LPALCKFIATPTHEAELFLALIANVSDILAAPFFPGIASSAPLLSALTTDGKYRLQSPLDVFKFRLTEQKIPDLTNRNSLGFQLT